MRRAAMAAGAVGAMLGVVALSTMGNFGGPFDSSIGPNILVNSVSLGECTSELWYTQRRVNHQCWECNPILQAIGGPAGAWAYCNTPLLLYSTRSLPDPAGSGTPAGVDFDVRNPGTHYSVFGELTVAVESEIGTCTGLCPAGTHSIVAVMQENREDGGVRTLGVAKIPCTAAANYCVSTNPNARNGCGSDAGIWDVVRPETIDGPLHYEVLATGAQCTRHPVLRLTGYALSFAYGDGGGT